MTWHRCHLFGEVFYLKPPSGPSQDPRPLCSRGPHLNPLPRGEADAAAPGEGKRTCGYNFAPTSPVAKEPCTFVQVSTRTKPLALRTRRLDPLSALW